MDFYVIPPLGNLDLMTMGERYFCLSQLYIKNKEYREFFQNKVTQGAWVTLDNGAGDHDTVSREQVLDIARELQPSELIPLDILFDGQKTLDNLAWTIEKMIQDPLLCDIEVFACPQGKNIIEWVQCYMSMLKNPSVTTIGMSKLAVPWVISESKGDVNIARDRNTMYKMLMDSNLVQKPLHFLGAGEPWEFELYKDNPLCRSTDSCFTVWGGMNRQRFGEEGYKRIPTPKTYFDLPIEKEAYRDVIHNIDYMRMIMK